MNTFGDIRNNFQIAMNKMNESKKIYQTTVDTFWLDGFKEFMKSTNFAAAKNFKKTGEVLRASFGSNDGEAESNIREFLKIIGDLKQTVYEIEYIPVGVISGDYAAYKIIFKKQVTDRLGKEYKKGDFIVFTNRYKTSKSGEPSIIGKKDLTPDKLGITRQAYETPGHLFSVVSEKINALDLPENYSRFILKSTEEMMNDSVNENKFNNLEEYTSSSSNSIDFKISDQLFDGIDQLSINNFQNDYGEILGGFLLFNVLKNFNVGMSFPTNSNEKLVDFYFDGYSISSKAGKKGGTPTGDTMIRKLHQMRIDGIINPEGTKENDFFNNVVDSWINAPKLSRSSIYNNIMNQLSVNQKDMNNSGYWHICKETGLPPKLLKQDSVVEYLDKLYSNPEEFKNFIKTTWEKSGMSWNNKMLEEYIEKYPKMGTNKIGVVFYCLQVEAKDILNDLYVEQLSKFSRMATDVKQVYLQVNVKRGTFSFKAVPFKTANFKFEQKGSIPNPFNANMGISASGK